jgi:hypothetical protein
MSGKKKQVSATNLDLRASLEEDVEAFLKKGNKIQEIPSGVSGQVSVAKKAPVEVAKPAATPSATPAATEAAAPVAESIPETAAPAADTKPT